jgi:hypothetical protein
MIMEAILAQNAREYAELHDLRLAERLGVGSHGIVHAATHNAKAGWSAIKVFRERESYRRERDVYKRLQDSEIIEVLGLHIPRLIRFEDRLGTIEISIVTRPYLLDFAGAYLDKPPQLPKGEWQKWLALKKNQFGARWPEVQAVMAAFEELGIYLLDVTPGNVALDA